MGCQEKWTTIQISLLLMAASATCAGDLRHIRTGREIPDEVYADQPYVVKTDDGDAGLRTPPGGGPIAEEQSFCVLSAGSFYCVYRTIDGHPACSYSRDGGHTWSTPQYARYADGRLIKHPRAANFVWKCGNGRYLYWFHNHGGRSYEGRNPAWLCGGIEIDAPQGKILAWSEPEIALYDDDPRTRLSYPDLIEDGGQFFLTETQKDVARVHPVDRALLAGLWDQACNGKVATAGLVLDLPGRRDSMPPSVPMPSLPSLTTAGGGFAIGVWVTFDTISPGQVLLDSRTESGRGLCLRTTSGGTVEILLNDGRSEGRWDCDPGLLRPGQAHHLVVNVDGGRVLLIGPGFKGRIDGLRIYRRYLRTSEAVGNFRADSTRREVLTSSPRK